MSEQTTFETSRLRRVLLMALPLIVFAGLALLFLLRLHDGGDPSRIPSALIGHPVPQTALPPLAGLVNNGEPVPGLEPGIFKGKVSVVNVWASWCVPCHDEAPLLTALGQDKRLQVIGINTRTRLKTPDAFSAATAIPSVSSASTATAAPPSNGACTACRRRSSSAATAASPLSLSARSRRTI